MAQAHATAHDDHHDHEAHSPQQYLKIWGVLIVLLVISIAGPEISHLFGASLEVYVMLFTAFGIAFVKAWLVIKHFMHLTLEKPIVWYILITCLVFLVLFFAGVSPDVKNHEGTNWVNVAAKAEIERGLAEYANKGAHGEHGAQAGEHGTEGHTQEPPEEQHEEVAPAPAAPAEPKFAALTTDAAKKSWLMKRGQKVYVDAACVTCHRSNGAGHGPFPTLIGQQQHMGDCATTQTIITGGMANPIEVNGQLFEQPMPPTQGLSAEDVAAVATYVRNSWGNDYGVCNP